MKKYELINQLCKKDNSVDKVALISIIDIIAEEYRIKDPDFADFVLEVYDEAMLDFNSELTKEESERIIKNFIKLSFKFE